MANYELSAQQRAAKLTWLMLIGKRYTVSEMAELLDMSYTGAYYLRAEIAEIINMKQSDNGQWYISE